MICRYALSMVAAVMLAGCGGSQPPIGAPAAMPQTSALATHAGRSFLSKRRKASCPCLYVANRNTSAVTVYPITATGNVKPLQEIRGPRTGLSYPHDVAVDASGNIYVSNTGNWSVTVYRPGATGDAKPLETIKGPKTELAFPIGVAIDSVNGDIYVSNNRLSSYGNGSVTIYPPGADGDVSPIGIIEGSGTSLVFPNCLALDAAGNIYVNNRYNYITYYPAGTTGDASPTRTIAGSLTKLDLPTQVAVDSSQNIYVANDDGNSATVYAAGANGNVAPIQDIHGGRTTIAGPFGTAVDGDGNIYVANIYSKGAKSIQGRVTVYAAGSNGNVRPIRAVEGDRTDLAWPTGIAIH